MSHGIFITVANIPTDFATGDFGLQMACKSGKGRGVSSEHFHAIANSLSLTEYNLTTFFRPHDNSEKHPGTKKTQL